MRTAVLVALGLLLLVALLGVTGAIELPFGLTRSDDEEGSGAGLEVHPDEAARREGVRLEAGEGAGRRTLATPGAASEVFGSVPRGARIVGRVVEPGITPMPVAGVRVVLVRPHPVTAYLRTSHEGRWDVLEATTDTTGRFAFANVRPARGYVVRTLGTGRPAASSRRLDLAPRQVADLGDLVLVEGGSFEGRVLGPGALAVAGAEVVVTWRVESILGMVLSDPGTLPEIEVRSVTDQHGHFLLAPLEPGPKTLLVSTLDHGGKVLARPEAVAGQRTNLGEIVLDGRGSVGGRVEWEDGTPVPGARVFSGEPRLDTPTLSSTVTGADGAFRLEHLEGEKVRLGVFLPGIPVNPSDDVPMGTLDHVIRLPLAGGLAGRVVRKQDGAPVTRFGVRLVPKDEEAWMARAVRTLVDTAVGPLGFVSPDGRFQIPFQARGRYVLVVSAEGFPDQPSEVFEVSARGKVDLGTFALVDGHTVNGVVRTALGQPLASAHIHLLSGATDLRVEGADILNSDLSVEQRPDAVTDAEGRFTLPAQTPGLYSLLVEHPHAVLRVVADVDLRSAPKSELEIVLQPAGEVEVRVLDDRGRAADEVDVVLVRLDGFAIEATTREGGQARWQSVPPGTCLVRLATLRESKALRTAAYTDDEALRAVTYEQLRRDGVEQVVRAGEALQVLLRLPRQVEVTLRVKPWAADLKPLRAVTVRHAASFWQRYLSSDEAGVFRLPLEPGTYEARVFPESGWDDSRVFEIVVPDVPAHTLDLGG